MDYGRQPPYQQNPSSYYFHHDHQQHPPPPPGTGYPPRSGSSSALHEPPPNHHQQLPSIYNPSSSERPSPPPTPLSAVPHMSSAPLPPLTSLGRGPGPPPGHPDHLGMYNALTGPRPDDIASGSRRSASPVDGPSSIGGRTPIIKRVGGKANVSSACAPCKKAHLACDVMRPCKRCVNMGKEDMCEDVPHKKRGRPKVNKGPMSTPYQRARVHGDDGSGPYRQPLPPPFPPPSAHPYDPIYHPPGPSSLHPYGQSTLPPPPGVRQNVTQPSFADPPDLFTMFTTTSMKVLRVTPGSSNLIGFHSNELLNLSLLDWIHPADRHLLDGERLRLVGAIHSEAARDLPAMIQSRSERELLSPADGMKDQYPNQNVRIVRADQQYSTFNVRLHLGGGLGASLYRTETHDRLYLVVSCLLIPNQTVPPIQAMPPHTRAPSAATTASSYGPPTPITPMTVGPPGGLPSFSSIAAGVEAPPPQPMGRYSGTPYSSRPSTGSQHASSYYPRGSALPAPLPPAGQAVQNQTTPTMYSKSPPPTYRSDHQSSYPPYDYHQPNQNYNADNDYRQNNHNPVQNDWRRHPGDGNPPSFQQSHTGPPASAPPGAGASMQTPTSAIPIDYSRRPWET